MARPLKTCAVCLDKTCVDCKRREYSREYMRNYYSQRPSYQNDCKNRMTEWKRAHPGVTAQWHRDARHRGKQYIDEYLKTHPCVDCGETDIVVLDFDHVRGRKIREVRAMTGNTIESIQREIDKCEVVCSNDHRRRTARRGLLGRAVRNVPTGESNG